MSAFTGVIPMLPPAPVKGGAPLAGLVITITTLLMMVPLVVVALRIYVRLYIVKIFGQDDMFMVVAMLFAFATHVAICFQASLGSPLGLLGMSEGALKAVFTFQLMYYTTTWAVKMSILSFCYNIFGRSVHSRVKVVCWACMTLVTTVFTVAFGTTLFACNPVSNAWVPLLNYAGCFNIASLQISHAVINACTDIMVFVLPIALLTRTNIDTKRRNFVVGIFVLALVAVVASFARIFAGAILATTLDKPKNWIMLPIFTTLEIDVAITSASLPALSPMIRSGIQRVAKHSGGHGWLSGFDESSTNYSSNKLSKRGSIAELKANGGIKLTRGYSAEKNEFALGGSTMFVSTKEVSSYDREEPVMVYQAPPRSQESMVRPVQMGAREAAPNAGRDMSLSDMLRNTGPGDENKWTRSRGGRGKANEILGV
ncbi:hypothetical protein EJ08DRAFT_156518 [Tothia fuscella]|uniref:Rhodopsin domain-containing protein n=1 Tax=Tothia fuscella TaxID=1048955 RepID=A0A9P4P1T2_9PEZI|nr:hypothetical protein EJ08DRAFT_156518 [Tothia fuscella]